MLVLKEIKKSKLAGLISEREERLGFAVSINPSKKDAEVPLIILLVPSPSFAI